MNQACASTVLKDNKVLGGRQIIQRSNNYAEVLSIKIPFLSIEIVLLISSSTFVVLKNIGPHFETWDTGVLGPVVLHGLDEGQRDLTWQKWSYKVDQFLFCAFMVSQ